MFSIFLNFLTDLDLIIKLSFIIFLVVFVKQRITKNWLAITAIVVTTVILIFFYWDIIGSIYIIYVLITVGIGSVLVDTFFVTMGEGQQKKQKRSSPSPKEMLGDDEYSDVDYEELAAQRRAAMKRFGGR